MQNEHKEQLAAALEMLERLDEKIRELLADVVTSDETPFYIDEERAALERANELATRLKAVLEMAFFWRKRLEKRERASGQVVGPAADERGVWYHAPTE